MSFSGGTVHCTIHEADTKVSSTEAKLPEHFTIGCAYCLELENRRLRESLEKVTKQRDALVAAIDVAKTIQPVVENKNPSLDS